MRPRTIAWKIVTRSHCERSGVEPLVFADDLLEREPRPRIRRTELAHRLPLLPVSQNLESRAGHSVNVSDAAKDSGLAVPHHFRNSSRIRPDHGNAGRQRFEGTQPERLARAGEKKEISRCEKRRDVVELAQKMNPGLETELSYFVLGFRPVRAVADHYKAPAQPTMNRGEHLNHVANPLHSPEVRDVHEYRPIAPDLFSQPGRILRSVVNVGVAEIVNHRHVAISASERVVCLLTEILRDGSQSIGFLDRELRYLIERRILADDRDVSAVKRGDHLHVLLLLSQHFPRDPGARSVRDRVMTMQQLESVRYDYLVHSHREREIVRRILE